MELAFDGADLLRLDADGDLVIATAGGEVRMRRPVIYQDTEAGRRPIEGGYVVDGVVIRIPLQIEPGAQLPKAFSVILTNPRGGATLGARITTEVRITDTR